MTTVVVGAGAAGLMAAIFAARGSHRVIVIERTNDGGRKILISGGGRCNVLPSELAAERFVTDSPAHLMRGMLRSWPLVEQRHFFERELDLPLALEEATGKLFPTSNRARDVRDRLIDRARQSGVEFQFNVSLNDLSRHASDWRLHTTSGTIDASRVVIATGGLSVPATGSDGSALSLIEALGHRVHAVYPALTPLTSDSPVHRALSGISLPVRIRARAQRRTTESSGGFLFTHRGYSGPSVLDVSHVAVRTRGTPAPATLRVQWTDLDAARWEALLMTSPALAVNVIATHLPQRLAAQLVDEAGTPQTRRAADLRRAERIALIERLTSYTLPWTGDEGFKKAEVTGGGVALDEVNPRTLESQRHPGLFLCGEILDAFGPIGGHNFAWAWSTGRLAGIGAGS